MKKFAAILALMGLGLSALAQTTLAASPQFNFMSQDLKTLTVANRTTNTGWQNNSVSANTNDSVAFQVYYHNGIVNSTATNTKIRLSFPTSVQNNIGVNVALSADNASAVNDSVTVNSSSSQKLTVDTSSIRWYPNRSQTAQYISASSSGDGYVEVNIGSIQGCWEYQGYVTFVGTLTSTPTANGDLTITKDARNVTTGGSFQNSADASPGDEVEFRLNVRNNNGAAVNNVRVRDPMPSYLSYISGSTRVDGTYYGDDINNNYNGLSLGSLFSGVNKEIIFRARVNRDSYFDNTSRTLTNYGYVSGDGVSEKQASAYVYVRNNANNLGLYLNKTVLNVSKGESSFSNSTNAQVGEKVRFSLKITNNTNNYLYNVIAKDTLPSSLNFVYGSTRLDNGNNYYSDSSLTNSNGLNVGTLYNGQTREVTFEATVNSGANGTLTNYGYAWADNLAQISSYAYVYVSGQNQNVGGYSFEKRVENISRPNGTNAQNEAFVGETLRYSLVVTNNSNSTLNNVRVTDVLPSYTSYVSVDNNGSYDSSSNAVAWNLYSLGSGQSTTVSYQVKVMQVPAGNTQIRNSAFIQTDNGSRDSNEVVTNVIVGQVLGAVTARTGRGGLAQQVMLASLISLLGLAAAYLYSERKEQILALTNNLKLSWKIWRSR